jgi:hypothetical protein
MDQIGHVEITRIAVSRFFHGRPEVDGLNETTYGALVNKGQAQRDSLAGPTWFPYFMTDGPAQWQHALGKPFDDPIATLNAIRGVVEGSLRQAAGYHARVDADRSTVASQYAAAGKAGPIEPPPSQVDELICLGNALHAIEDSYSEAHDWRADSANSGDPNAPIRQIMTFDSSGVEDDGEFGASGRGTHAGNIFDAHTKKPDGAVVLHPVDEAAITAAVIVMNTYYQDYQPLHGGQPALDKAVADLFQPAADIRIAQPDQAYFAERDRRERNQELNATEPWSSEDHETRSRIASAPGSWSSTIAGALADLASATQRVPFLAQAAEAADAMRANIDDTLAAVDSWYQAAVDVNALSQACAAAAVTAAEGWKSQDADSFAQANGKITANVDVVVNKLAATSTATARIAEIFEKLWTNIAHIAAGARRTLDSADTGHANHQIIKFGAQVLTGWAIGQTCSNMIIALIVQARLDLNSVGLSQMTADFEAAMLT